MAKKVEKSEAEWRKQLTPAEYRIIREKGTDAPFAGEYTSTKNKGVYRCRACGEALFSSDTKYDSGCGWPSFYQAVDGGNVAEQEDRSHGMRRTEILCAACDGHLGHVFPDGPNPTGLRYCVNSTSVKLDQDMDPKGGTK